MGKEEKKQKVKKPGRAKWIMFYILALIIVFGLGAASKMISPSWSKDYTVEWDDNVGTLHADISYGSEESNRFDLYLPADTGKSSYGLVVYLHAGELEKSQYAILKQQKITQVIKGRRSIC